MQKCSSPSFPSPPDTTQHYFISAHNVTRVTASFHTLPYFFFSPFLIDRQGTDGQRILLRFHFSGGGFCNNSCWNFFENM
ncbi:hypothetical protein E2C01_096537 [Portunus trituberculatus]|uniref:Uncharacterized protein n=1 Tax=Portunus trituberculatus TaxID=210409 RepID=A0A5B7K385_PORTR|nr:hypothetical protein [Portunus trituberculatus]